MNPANWRPTTSVQCHLLWFQPPWPMACFVGLPHRWEKTSKGEKPVTWTSPYPTRGTTGRPVFQDGKKHGHGLPWSIGRMSEVKISQVPCCFSIFPRPETSPKVAKVFQVLLPGSLTCRSKLGWIPKRKEQILFQPSILPQINSLSNFRGGYDLPFGMRSFFHSPQFQGLSLSLATGFVCRNPGKIMKPFNRLSHSLLQMCSIFKWS